MPEVRRGRRMRPKILIVDDDRYTRRVVETLLSREPEISALSPQIVPSDARGAREHLERDRPQVVIVDVLRGDGSSSGVELAELARKAGATVLATSALAVDEATARVLAAAQLTLYRKPLQVRDLVRAAREALVAQPALVEPEPEARPASALGLGAASGALAERPLSLLLFDALEERVSGQVTVQRGRMKKEILLEDGLPVGVRSNIRRETLSSYLLMRRALDDKQVDVASEAAHRQHIRFGQAVVQLGYLSEAEVVGHLAAHVKLKLVNCLRWRDGMWDLVPGTVPADVVRTPIDLAGVVFRGLAKSARADVVAAELETYERLRLIPTPRVDDHGAAFRKEFGSAAIDALSGQPRLGDLLRTGNPVELLPALDALIACGLAVLDPPPLAVPAPAPARARRTASPDADPLSLWHLRDATQARADRGRTSLPLEDLFEEERIRTDPPPADPAGDARAEILRAALGLGSSTAYELLGLARGATEAEVSVAYDARRARFAAMEVLPIEDARPKLLEVMLALRRAFETLSDPVARAGYDQGLEPPAPSDAFQAEAAYREGEELLRKGEPREAAACFARAVALRSDQAEFHASLAWAEFLAEGKGAVEIALGHLEQALAIDPDDAAAHEYLGRIALDGGAPEDLEQASAELGRALDLDPTRKNALSALEGVLSARGAWQALERRYRKILHDLGDRERALQAALWRRLGALHEERLGDARSALLALDVAASLEPEDVALPERIAALATQVPAEWAIAARALRAGWRLSGSETDHEAGRRLMRFHLAGGRVQAAARVAHALRALGASDPEVQSAAALLPSRALSAPARLDREPLELGAEQQALGRLLASLGPVARALRPVSLEDLGILPQHRVAAGAVLAEAIARARALLGIARTPEVYEWLRGGSEVRAALVEPPVLAVGPVALGSADVPAMKFQAARAAFALARPERVYAIAWSQKRLRALVLGAFLALGHEASGQEGDPDTARVRSRVALEPEGVRKRLRELADAFVAARVAAQGEAGRDLAAFAPDDWVLGVHRAADRVGVLSCDDVAAAVRVLRPDAEATAALIDWVLTEDYARLRLSVYPPEALVGDVRDSSLNALFNEGPTDPGVPPALAELFDTDEGSGSGPLPVG